MEENIVDEKINKENKKIKVWQIIVAIILAIIVIKNLIGFVKIGIGKCYCNNEFGMIGTTDLVSRECEICGKDLEDGPSSSNMTLCLGCSLVTFRCVGCGYFW